MNKEIEKYINDEVGKFRNELISKVDAILEKENKPKTVWDLKRGDKYYLIMIDGEIKFFTFDNHPFDVRTREIRNMFLTQEEAQFELERRKIKVIMSKYSRSFECGRCNWIIFYDYVHKAIDVTYSTNYDYGTIYFESQKIAQQVIDEIGEDRLKKYWFKVVD